MFTSIFAPDGPTLMSAAVEASKVEVQPTLTSEHPEFDNIIENVFLRFSTVAVIGSGVGVISVSEDIAAEQGLLGRRVVLVSVDALLHPSQLMIPASSACGQGRSRNVWIWPPAAGQQNGRRESAMPEEPDDWLSDLRGHFDSVMLQCPTSDRTTGSLAIAAKADSAVLAVTAGTLKHRVIHDHRILLLSGVKLAGCILVRRSEQG